MTEEVIRLVKDPDDFYEEENLPHVFLPNERGNPGLTNHFEIIDKKTTSKVALIIALTIATVLLLITATILWLLLTGRQADHETIWLIVSVAGALLVGLSTFIIRLRSK